MKRYHIRECFILTFLVSCSFAMCLGSGVSMVYAENAADHVNIVVPTSCSFSDEQISGDSEHSAAMHNSEYRSEIGTTTFKVYCNDNSGYSVYAIGYSGDEYGNTEMIHGSDTTYNFATSTATSGSNSNWAMKLLPVSGTYAPTIQSDSNGSYTGYHVVPTTYTKIATFPSNTDVPGSGTGLGSAFQSTYAVWISNNQVAGTYTGKVRYTMIHPHNGEAPLQPQQPTTGCISYFANASNAVGTMGCQSATDGNTVTLFASNFSRDGYGFAGWSDAFDYATNPNAHFYGPNEDITVPNGTTANGFALYAVWVKSQGSFQDSAKTASVCNSLTAASTSGARTLDSVSALTDSRDGQTYAIAKLADNKCWMIENLRLADTHQEGANTVPTTLTTTNTNNPLNNNDPTNPTVTLKHNYSDTNTYPTLSSTSSDATSWCQTDTAACDDQSRIRTDNTANRVTYTTGQTMSAGSNLYSYGNYYNWYSATAGRGTYGFSTNNNSTAGDLCPTNWRLPKGGNKTRIESNDDNDFWNLVVDTLNGSVVPANYASSNYPYYTGAEEAGPVDALIRTWPNNFVHSGYVNGASLVSRGSSGRYWSSTANSTVSAYFLYFYSTTVYPGTNDGYKYYGRTTRCLAAQ